ncbi:ATP-binding cassette domain-containing protein [Pseudonocardia sp. NPDC049154]|uniref:ABC transporter ATP-binding protein n=1 Tax=Pseudonocardia sp. NPDC049154 TaxID=3155501 RepID=UPI0033CD4588
MLEVSTLRGGYREGVTVFDDISFSLSGGAIGFIGRNGAGKTCLAQTLSGGLRSTGGSVVLDGRDITSLSSRGKVRAGVSLVPEGRLVFGQLTVRENLVVAAHAAGRSNERIGQLEDQFPVLGRKRAKSAASLSGGEQQLLAIARALIQDPKVIVLDEPSLGLSPVAVDELTATLRTVVTETGQSMVLMEQNGELLTGLCDEVVLVEQGLAVRRLDMRNDEDQNALFESYLGV